MDNQDQIVETYIIHLLNKPLEKVLKRLRKEEVSGGKINDIYISFPIDKNSLKIETTGSAIKAALQEMCGNDIHAYIIEKIKQLHTLGFSERPISISLQIRMPEGENIADVFLGLKKNVPIENVREYETRFGIRKLKQEFPTGTTLTLTPSPVKECKLVVRHPSLLESVVLKAQVFVPVVPRMPEDKLKIIVRSAFIVIERKSLECTISIEPIGDSSHSLEEWGNYCRAQLILGLGGGSIEITDGKLSSIIDLEASMSGLGSREQCKMALDRIELLQKLFKLAGTVDKKVSLTELDECTTIQSMCIEEVHNFESVSIALPKVTSIEEGKEQEILVASSAIFGEERLLHLAIAKVLPTAESERIRLVFLSVIPKEIRMIDKADEIYTDALKKASETYKLSWTIKSEPKKAA